MPDKATQTDTDQTDSGQTTETAVDATKQSDTDFMSETVEAIKETQKTILDKDSKVDTEGTQDNEVVTRLVGQDIPDDFSNAAEASGMSKEDIIAMADKHTDEELIEMIPALKDVLKELEKSKGEDKDEEKDGKQDDKIDENIDNKDIDVEAITERISKELEEKFGKTLEEIDKFKGNQKEQADKQLAAKVSEIFDETSKEFPVFGKTDELPKFPSGRLAGQFIETSPAMKARLEVLRYANSFMSGGTNIDNAMTNALATYKGLHLEKELERKQVWDLKAHETKLSGARVGMETKKKYADTREAIIDDIKQMQRAAGI